MSSEDKKPKPLDADTEKAAERSLLNEQQFLIKNMDIFAAPRSGYNSWVKASHGADFNKAFKHIIPLVMSPAEIVSVINKTNGAEEFLTASSSELSTLVPSIKLYMPMFDDSKKPKLKDELIYFGNYIKASDKVKYDPKGKGVTSEIFLQSAKGRGVGIKSFVYEQHTNHPGEKSMTATVEIFFQSIADLVSGPYIEMLVPILDPDNPSSPSNSAKGGKKDDEKRLTALKQAKKNLANAAATAPSWPASRLKAIIGWAPSATSSSSLPRTARLHEFARSSQEVIILEMTKYNLAFGSEGQATLKIDYVARSDSAMSGPQSDMLSGGERPAAVAIPIKKLTESWTVKGGKGDINSLDKDSYVRKTLSRDTGDDVNIYLLEKKVRRDVKLHTIALEITRLEGRKDEDKKEEAIEKAERALELSKAFAARVANQTRSVRYGALLKKMNKSKKIFQVLIPEGVLGLTDGWLGDEVSTGTGFSSTAERQKLLKPNRKPVRLNESVVAAATTTDSEERKDAIAGVRSDHLSSMGRVKSGKVAVKYMLLGDLIDAAYSLTDQKTDKKRGIMLGGFILPELNNTVGPNREYNIADIPISISSFENWFLEKVVKTQRSSYPFRAFLRDILKLVVEPAMNSEGLLKPRKPGANTGYGFHFTTFSSLTEFQKGRSYHENSPEIEKLANLKRLANIRDQSDYSDYLVVLSREGFNGTGDYATDAGRGIYHLILGANRGPVKSFSFTQQENKYMQSINMAGASTGNRISVLAIPQDADITLVGTTLFRQGSLVFIDAEFAMGKEVAKKLKIGGYYLISKVTHELNAEKYNTKLKCIWQNDYQEKSKDKKTGVKSAKK